MPPPLPPMVKDGLMMQGNPTFSSASYACSMSCAMPCTGVAKPMERIARSNSSRSSALSMASTLAPISSTPYFFKTPWRFRSSAQLRAVCPPMVGRIASGFSLAIIFSTMDQVTGSMYVASAIDGSVMMVAGLEFTRMTRIPSSLSAWQAWVPE